MNSAASKRPMWSPTRYSEAKAHRGGSNSHWHSRDRRGTGGGTGVQSRSKLGNLWSHLPFLGHRPAGESISPLELSRISDEAIVSDEPRGQHNLMASQGPLDERAGVAGGRAALNRKVLERVIPDPFLTFRTSRKIRPG